MYAIILGGGRGLRLSTVTDDLPKPLVRVCGRPILAYHLQWLEREGLTDVIIACAYKADSIVNYCNGLQSPQLRIRLSIETEPLGRGGAAKEAARLLPHGVETAIISQGDTISDIPLQSAVNWHKGAATVATLIVVPYRSRFGVIDVCPDGRVKGFREKPRLPYWAGTGTIIAERRFFELLPAKGDEDHILAQLAEKGALSAFRTNYYWRSIDTPKDIEEMERDLTAGPLPHEEVFGPTQTG